MDDIREELDRIDEFTEKAQIHWKHGELVEAASDLDKAFTTFDGWYAWHLTEHNPECAMADREFVKFVRDYAYKRTFERKDW